MKFEDKVKILREKKHKGKESGSFLKDVIKMAKGEELEYILGEVDFCNAKIDLSLRPMIPRKETEFWVKQMLENLKNDELFNGQRKANLFRALDLFSGSGCVGISILKNIENSYVDFVEYDLTLKDQIEISLKKNKKENNGNVTSGDVWGNASGMYDLITAVPPYVNPKYKEEVMKELKKEKEIFFFDKEDGYYYHRQVLSNLKKFLNKNGSFYLEFDIEQKSKIEEMVKEYGFSKYFFLKDPYGHEYVLNIVI